MRMSSVAIALSITLGPAFVMPLLATRAQAVQDQPAMIGGIETVCTGVGSAKDNPAWSAYPVKLVFANNAGQDLAQVHVAITQKGKTAMETDCDAPWLLVKAPAGVYGVKATVGPLAATGTFSVTSGPQKTVTLAFPSGLLAAH